MDSSTGEVRDLYALLSLSNPDLIFPYNSCIATQIIVAAKIVASSHNDHATVAFTTIEESEYRFTLDLNSRTYHSKGNWIWITRIEVSYSSKVILTIPIKPRVIDIPYAGNRVCAHWLFKNIDEEINETLKTQLL
tara:strand:+ start:1077 stop:1481 length:405 start_codon:yes stop_codon:yes gene_type:complete